jgi:hypothetical protein
LDELRKIPGVGEKTAEDFKILGINRIDELKGKNPQELYERLCSINGQHLDRCILYVFRCAVYYASEKKHEPEKLKWWNWKE